MSLGSASFQIPTVEEVGANLQYPLPSFSEARVSTNSASYILSVSIDASVALEGSVHEASLAFRETHSAPQEKFGSIGTREVISRLKAQLSHSDGIRGFFVTYLTGVGDDTPAEQSSVPPVLAAASRYSNKL
jgi:hypothetical protein